MNHFRSLIRGVVTKDCEIFKTRSSVLEICETLNNGVFIEKKKKRRHARAAPIRVGNGTLSFQFLTLAPKVGNFLFWLSVESRRTEGRARSEQAQFRRIFSRKLFEKIIDPLAPSDCFLIRQSDSLFDSKP